MLLSSGNLDNYKQTNQQFAGQKHDATILLVEDEEDLASIVQYHLTKEGYTVVHAPTGADALQALNSQSVSLVLLDLMLPDMSGVDICRKIRSNGVLQNLPVIMVTAKGEEIDRVVGFEVGADDYVVKPFSSRELILRIKAFFVDNLGSKPMRCRCWVFYLQGG